MSERRVTSQDVADLAGVSRTTVSFVMNNTQQVVIRPETRQKVLQAASQLGYEPNASARALASRRAKAIGLIMTRDPHYISSDPFLPQILGGLLDPVKQAQLNLLTEWVEPGKQPQIYRSLIRAKHIDGMIVMTPRFDDPGLKELEDSDIPTVLMGTVAGRQLYSVDVDNTASARVAVSHLTSLGHRRIGCVLNAPLPYSSSSQRLEGYQLALADAGIPWDPTLVRQGDFDLTSGYLRMGSLLAEHPEISAVFVASDQVAIGAMTAIREAGLSIPDDISVMGFDDIPTAAFTDPSLTTIRVPAREIARKSCELLLRLIQGERPEPRAVTLPTEFILRQSTQEAGRSTPSEKKIQNVSPLTISPTVQ